MKNTIHIKKEKIILNNGQKLLEVIVTADTKEEIEKVEKADKHIIDYIKESTKISVDKLIGQTGLILYFSLKE